jgi:hypothetical protein
LDNTPDPEVLERVRRGLPMPGLAVISRSLRLGAIVDRLEVLTVASREGEWEGQVLFITSE